MRLSSAFPGTIAGPREPPLRRVSRCRTSRPDVREAPWQTAQLPTRRLTADSRIAGSCALPAKQKNSRNRPAAAAIQTQSFATEARRNRGKIFSVSPCLCDQIGMARSLKAGSCINSTFAGRDFVPELSEALVFSLAGPTRPMVQLLWVGLFRSGFPAATQNRTERRSRSEAPPQSLAEDHNQRVTRWRCRPREGTGCQAGTGARQSRGNLSDSDLAIHGSSLDRR